MSDIGKKLKALSNKNRLQIFEYLRKHKIAMTNDDGKMTGIEGKTVGEIADQFDLALSTISHHLKELHEAGLIKCSQKRQWNYCEINRDAIDELKDFFTG